MLMHMDDGIGAAASKNATRELATEVQNDLHQSGLLVNSEKSDFQPRQFGEFLEYTLYLESGKFRVPRHKIDDLQSLLIGTLSASDSVTARFLAKITGVFISMGLAFGPVSRLFTRSLYHAQNSVLSLNCKVSLGEEAIKFLKLDGQPIWQSSPRISYSDEAQLVGAATWYYLEMLLPGENGNNRAHAVAQPTENSKPYGWSWNPSHRDFNSRNASIGQTIKTH